MYLDRRRQDKKTLDWTVGSTPQNSILCAFLQVGTFGLIQFFPNIFNLPQLIAFRVFSYYDFVLLPSDESLPYIHFFS